MIELRGLTLHNEPYVFSIQDGPTRINDEHTVLTMKENSPILKTRSIVRYYNNLGEMDLVYDLSDNLIGRVVYDIGFNIVVDATQEIIPIRKSNIHLYRFELNTNLSEFELYDKYRSIIRYKVVDYLFTLNRIIYMDSSGIYLHVSKTVHPRNPDLIELCVGIDDPSNRLTFGTILPDGIVTLWDYHPMIRCYDRTYRELEEDDVKL